MEKMNNKQFLDSQKLLHKIYLKSYKNTDTEGGTVVAYLFISTWSTDTLFWPHAHHTAHGRAVLHQSQRGEGYSQWQSSQAGSCQTWWQPPLDHPCQICNIFFQSLCHGRMFFYLCYFCFCLNYCFFGFVSSFLFLVVSEAFSWRIKKDFLMHILIILKVESN